MAWNVNEFFNSDIAELKRMKEQFCSDINQVIEYKYAHPEEYPNDSEIIKLKTESIDLLERAKEDFEQYSEDCFDAIEEFPKRPKDME